MSERIIISKTGYGKTAKFYEDLIKETIEEKDKEIERLKNILKKIDNLIEDIDDRPLVDEDMFGVFYNEYQSLIEEELRGDK